MGHYAINKQSFTNYNLGSGAVSVDSMAGGHSVGQMILSNPNTVPVYFQFYYAAAGSVAVGSTKPDLVIMVAPVYTLTVSIPGGWWTHGNLSLAVVTTPNGNTGPTSFCTAAILYG